MSIETVNPDPLLSAEAAGRFLGLDTAVKNPGHTVRRLCRLGRLPFVTVAGRTMIRKSALEKYIAENTHCSTG